MCQWCLHKRMMWCLSHEVQMWVSKQCFSASMEMMHILKVSNESYHIELILFTWLKFLWCMFMELLTLQTVVRRCQLWCSDALHIMNHAVVARHSSEVSSELISATTCNMSTLHRGVKYDVRGDSLVCNIDRCTWRNILLYFCRIPSATVVKLVER